MVVRRAHLVALLVRQLQFDMSVVKAHFVEQCGGDAPESVPGHAVFVAHAGQRAQNGVVAHGFFVVTFAGE